MMAGIVVLIAGVVSAVLYARKRLWINALLVLAAAIALGAMLSGLSFPADGAKTVAIKTDGADVDEAALLAVPQAHVIALTGDGLREAQWRDLPARPLQWTPPQSDVLHLDFPRSITLGRSFTLTVRRSRPQAGWRLQLLAENQQVIAEATASGAAAQLSLRWLPPVAEAMVLQARLLDAAGKTIAQGPLPLQVRDALPLQILGRFDAPSFDARTLNQLLVDGGAVLDWQVTLGKAIARGETARAALTEPNAMMVDAAYIEHLNTPARAALLAQVAQGLPLIVLGDNASDGALWQREFGLHLHPQSATTEKEDTRQFSIGATSLAMPPAALNPDDKVAQPWSVLAADSKQLPWLWQRSWQKGRVIWLGVTDWHRYAITAPNALALWWQGALDQAALGSPQKMTWQFPDAMPVPGLRSEICAQGMAAGTALQINDMPAAVWQARADKADAVCAAVWPKHSGWLKISSGAQSAMEYVYAKADWPTWQQALRRDATAQYAARTPAAEAPQRTPLPSAPFGVAFALAMLALWWRERR